VERCRLLVPPSEVQCVLWLDKTRVDDILATTTQDGADFAGFRVPESSRRRKRLLAACDHCTANAVCGEHLEPASVPVAALVGDDENEGIAFGTRKLLVHWAAR